MTKPAESESAEQSPPRWTEYVEIGSVEPALANAKRHAMEAIAESFKRFGYVEAITIDERTGRLVAGHGRIASLILQQQDGGDAPDGIMVSETGEWSAPVQRGWSSADDYEARAYLIASNRLTETGGWDYFDLATELVGLADGPGLDGVGYTMQEAEDLRGLFDPPPSLSELEAELGEHNPADLWPVLRFRVSPKVRETFLAVTSEVIGDDSARFAYLVKRVEEAIG